MGIKRWALAISIVVVVAGLLVLLFVQSGADEQVLESLLPRVEERLGAKITWEEVSVSLTAVSFEGVRIGPAEGGHPFATIEQVGLGVRAGPLLAGDLELTGVRMRGLAVRMGARAEGAGLAQWRELIARVEETLPSGLEGERGTPRPDVQIESGSVAMDDGRFSFAVDAFSGRMAASGGVLVQAEGFRLSHGDWRLVAGDLAEIRYRSEGERLAVSLDRPQLDIPTGRPELLVLFRDARATLEDAGVSFGEEDRRDAAEDGEDGGEKGGDGESSGPSARATIVDGTVTLYGGEDRREKTVLREVKGDITVSRGGVVSLRSTGGTSGTDARWTAAAAWPIGGYPRVTIEVPDMPLSGIGPILFDSEHVVWTNASADGALTMEAQGGWRQLQLEGQASISGLELRHDGLANEPLSELDFQVDFKATYDREQAVAHLERMQISRGLARITLRGDVRRDRLAFDLFANAPPTACRQVFGAVPPQLRRRLEDVRLDGTISLDMHLAVDEKTPQATQLEVSLDNRCRIADFGRVMHPDALRRPFAYTAFAEDGSSMRLLSGPGSDRWTPYSLLSPYLVEAALTTEDGKFRHHAGVTVPELRRAIELNLSKSALAHGASTITMQLAKNLFLTRERTVARKLEELFFTWYLETHFSKDEILELYFNVIEFGPSLYGIKDAAEHYFGREPSELNLVESVFLIKLLPSPVIRHAAYVQGTLSERKAASLRKVMATMKERRRISQEELLEGLGQTLVFHREGDPPVEPRRPVDRPFAAEGFEQEAYDDEGESEQGWNEAFE